MVNWKSATTSPDSLVEIADAAADAIMYRLGERDEQMAFLELAAAELNRRHGAASEQTVHDMHAAVHLLTDLHQMDMYAENLDYRALAVSRARALGVMVDRGTYGAWAALYWETRETKGTALEDLHGGALCEHRARGFRYERPATLIPADANELVAPF